jgi:phosphate uptake regulator
VTTPPTPEDWENRSSAYRNTISKLRRSLAETDVENAKVYRRGIREGRLQVYAELLGILNRSVEAAASSGRFQPATQTLIKVGTLIRTRMEKERVVSDE